MSPTEEKLKAEGFGVFMNTREVMRAACCGEGVLASAVEMGRLRRKKPQGRLLYAREDVAAWIDKRALPREPDAPAPRSRHRRKVTPTATAHTPPPSETRTSVEESGTAATPRTEVVA